MSRVAALLPVHASSSTKITSPSIVIYLGHLSPTQIAAKNYDRSVASSAILDQSFVPGTLIDSAAMMNVVENTSHQKLAAGKRVNILGVTGDMASAQVADVVFSIKTKAKKPYVLATKGTTSNWIPTGARATLLFEKNLWKIPMAFLPTMTASTSQAHISDGQPIQASPTTIPEITISADRQPTCASKDGRTASTIRNVIATRQQDDTNAAVPISLVL